MSKEGYSSESQFNKERTGSGTYEWAEHVFNIGRGCSHNYLYCYAREQALRFSNIANSSEWTTETIIQSQVERGHGKKNGVIMYPTTHDITPYYLEASVTVLLKMLRAGNKVLIVSKPHLACIEALCGTLKEYTENILFRFTIGSLNATVCKAWEPGAPDPKERLAALSYAFSEGFATSVSMEPMLEGAKETIEYFYTMAPVVTNKIWIGKMNKVDQRVDTSSPEVRIMVDKIKDEQRDEAILYLYEQLKNHPKVEWKDSIKNVLANLKGAGLNA